MTNRERLAKASDEEIAIEMCNRVIECSQCIGLDLCVWGGGRGNGILKWLEMEVEDGSD